MKQITIEQLHRETERWVREAVENGRVVITDHGQPAQRKLGAGASGQGAGDAADCPGHQLARLRRPRARLIYFDAAYIAKCHLSERGAELVIRLAETT